MTHDHDEPRLLARLRSVVGPEHVLTDPDQRAGHETDWTGAWSGTALAVVRPWRDEEVVEVLRACLDAGVPVVPQGGNTGLVGGGVPVNGGVVVSTTRMRTLMPVEQDGTLVVDAGATLAEVQRHAAEAGWQLGVDLAAREQATIGGMVATDAGGVSVVGHGSMREHVTGLVVAMPGGLQMPGRLGLPRTDAWGHDLCALLIGSEGTLGVVTTVQLQLDRPVTVGATALLRVEALDEVGAAVARVQANATAAGARLLACELLTADGLRLVAHALGAANPARGDHDAALLVDLAAPVAEASLAAVAAGVDDDPVVALSTSGRRRLWEVRERHTEVVAADMRPVKLDVAVPVPQLGALLGDLTEVVRGVVRDARPICWGHAAEGRLHVNVLGVGEREHDVAAAVYELVARHGGSVVSEHGAGRAKLPYLHLTSDPAALAEARLVKDTYDPRGLMNPGVRLPARRLDDS